MTKLNTINQMVREFERIINGIKIVRLFKVEESGDWHDAPLKWKVEGPKLEVQKFATKKEATRYASIRRTSKDQTEAFRRYT